MNYQDQPCANMATQSERKFNDILNYQKSVYEKNEREFKNLYELRSRLDDICNRINGAEYPKNFPRHDCENSAICGDKMPIKAIEPDGFVATLIKHNEVSGNQNNELKNIVDSIREAVNYIELHV